VKHGFLPHLFAVAASPADHRAARAPRERGADVEHYRRVLRARAVDWVVKLPRQRGVAGEEHGGGEQGRDVRAVRFADVGGKVVVRVAARGVAPREIRRSHELDETQTFRVGGGDARDLRGVFFRVAALGPVAPERAHENVRTAATQHVLVPVRREGQGEEIEFVASQDGNLALRVVPTLRVPRFRAERPEGSELFKRAEMRGGGFIGSLYVSRSPAFAVKG
jgi:hypothetical protein|tara:strand:+ start:1526 stop:2191 length:666 start_codon:yes stop_codon:yes gene_type:complete